MSNEIEPPKDERRLSMSTVYWQMFNDRMQICAVSFSRRRGGTVLEKSGSHRMEGNEPGLKLTCPACVYVR